MLELLVFHIHNHVAEHLHEPAIRIPRKRRIAGELGMGTVVVPRHAGVLSALGMLLADRLRDYAAGALGRSDFEKLFERLERRALRETPGAEVVRMADIRYEGQSYELTVPWRASDPAAPFHAEHLRSYGYANERKPIEVVTLRLRARQAIERPRLRAPRRRAVPPAARRLYSGGRWCRAAAVTREGFPVGALAGPALVLDYGSTTLIPAGWSGRIERGGSLVMRRED